MMLHLPFGVSRLGSCTQTIASERRRAPPDGDLALPRGACVSYRVNFPSRLFVKEHARSRLCGRRHSGNGRPSALTPLTALQQH